MQSFRRAAYLRRQKIHPNPQRTEECEQALQHLKKALSEPLVLSRPNVEEVLYLYLVVASEAVSAALIRETTGGQKPVYFMSKALQGP
ncbi:hypothetical protein A2U01_0073273, partial [Trifolium medium]|nr:hypothetical protein [Trifolium medium]